MAPRFPMPARARVGLINPLMGGPPPGSQRAGWGRPGWYKSKGGGPAVKGQKALGREGREPHHPKVVPASSPPGPGHCAQHPHTPSPLLPKTPPCPCFTNQEHLCPYTPLSATKGRPRRGGRRAVQAGLESPGWRQRPLQPYLPLPPPGPSSDPGGPRGPRVNGMGSVWGPVNKNCR